MTDYAARIMEEMKVERRALGIMEGRPLPVEARDMVLNRMCALFIKEATAEKKKAKKDALDERAQAIFNLYPNRQGGLAALQAIDASIREDGFEKVHEMTVLYASAVAKWPRHYRYSQNPQSKGKDMVPHASTWFNQRRYRDDPNTWKRVGDAPPPPPKKNLEEPIGWRNEFPDFLHVNNAWEKIDLASQSYIVEQMKKRNSA